MVQASGVSGELDGGSSWPESLLMSGKVVSFSSHKDM